MPIRFCTCVALFVIVALPLPVTAQRQDRSPDLQEVAQSIIDRTNEFREEQKLPELAANKKLDETARQFAAYMARTGQYGHTADGRQPGERVAAQGYEYCIVSENIAYQFHSAGFTKEELVRNFVEGWKSSPGHRKNMLDPDVVETGVAVVRRESNGYYYAVQMFGRPKSKRILFEIRNEAGGDIRYTLGGRSYTLPPRSTRRHEGCRPEALLLSGEKTSTAGVQPESGDRFIVSRTAEGELEFSRVSK